MAEIELYPMTFRPILNSMIWGGEKIIPFKGLISEQKMVGESWELSGIEGSESIVAEGELSGATITELLNHYGAKLIGAKNYDLFGNEFPLLIKFIDAREDLSIQVHPNDEIAHLRHNTKGKTEMWYVVEADKGAKLRSGFARKVTACEYRKSVEANTILDTLKEYDVVAGDLFFLPAGRVHSIGAGCFIAEIQQTSNITYRIYDFNRTDTAGNPRELHTEQAIEAIDFSFEHDYRTLYNSEDKDQNIELVQCPYFTTTLLDLTTSKIIDYSSLDSFVIYICVSGSAFINNISIKQGQTLLLPATIQNVKIDTVGCKILTTYIE